MNAIIETLVHEKKRFISEPWAKLFMLYATSTILDIVVASTLSQARMGSVVRAIRGFLATFPFSMSCS